MSAAHATVHAQSEAKETTYWLEDLGSTNGTRVGGVRLARGGRRLIGDGDLVQVGAFTLQVVAPHEGEGEEAAEGSIPGGTAGLALDWLGAFAVRPFPSVRVVEGPLAGTRLELLESGQVYAVGRGDEASLPVPDPSMSREHFFVVRRDARVFVRDGGSKHGVALGDERLPAEAEVLWRPALHLRAGGTVLALEPATREQPIGAVERGPGEDVVEAPAPLEIPSLDLSNDESPPALAGARRGLPKGLSKTLGLPALVGAVVLILALAVVGLVWIASAHAP